MTHSIQLFVTSCLLLLTISIVHGQKFYTPEIPKRPVVLLDYYHHAKPQLKIGRFVVTGGYATRVGRYGINDFSHPDSFDILFDVLEAEFALIIDEEPFTDKNLDNADIVFMFMPDSRDINPKIPIISDAEIENLDKFVKRGGSLILMENAFGHTERNSLTRTEKYVPTQFRKLFRRFGLDWNEDDTGYVDNAIGSEHPYFYDVDVFHYGGGCTFKYLDGGKNIKTLLYVHGALGKEDVEGPCISLVRHGKGKVLAVGDSGSWGDNISRPWSQNGRILLQMFRLLKKDTGIHPAQFKPNQSFNYKMKISRINVLTDKNNLSKLKQPYFKHAKINRPIFYFEGSGDVNLKCVDVNENQVSTFQIKVTDYKRFDKQVIFPQDQYVTIKSSRLGSIADVTVSDFSLMKLAPDLIHLLAFIPNDGVRIGDRWNKILHLPLPPIRGADIPSVRSVDTKMIYVRDEKVNGHDCRLLLSTALVWLDDINVTPEELLQFSGINYRLQSGKGGGYQLKREQWVDKKTGVVVRTRIQSRVMVWMRDIRKSKKYTNADIDEDMYVLTSQKVVFDLVGE